MSTSPWEFDLSHSSITFRVRHLMVSKVHGRFRRWTGTLELDDEDLTRSQLAISIEAASIDTEDERRDAHLRSGDFLEVDAFPAITFRSVEIRRGGDDRYLVAGELTIHGVSRPVTLEVDGGQQVADPWGGIRTGFSARTSISRKEFGLIWNLALEAGGFAVGDRIEIAIEIEAIKKTASAAA